MTNNDGQIDERWQMITKVHQAFSQMSFVVYQILYMVKITDYWFFKKMYVWDDRHMNILM